MKLIDRIIEVFEKSKAQSLSDWDIATRLYPDFWKSNPSNGARVANIRKACYKSDRIIQHRDDVTRYSLRRES